MASAYTLDFEKPLLELERQIDDLKRIGTERQIDIEGELEGLQGKLESLRAEIYRNLTPAPAGHGGPPPPPAVHPRLSQHHLHRLHRAARRPALHGRSRRSSAAGPGWPACR